MRAVAQRLLLLTHHPLQPMRLLPSFLQVSLISSSTRAVNKTY